MRLSEPSWMNEEYEILRDSVRRFIAAEIEPHYEAWEEAGIVPREIWNRLGEHGFLAPDMPEQYGGAGGSYQHLALIIAEFARLGFATFAGSMIGVHSAIVNHYILNHGSEEQKRRYLPAMASGDMVAAIAMTEPGAGSDLQGIRTVAVRDGNGYILNGSKTFISNGQQCDFVVVVAKTDNTVAGAKGISLLFVEKDAAGFSRGRNLDKIGLHSADTSELFFDDVRVDGGAVLGAEHGGFAVLMEELPRERLTLAISGLAAAEGALQWTIDYVRERQIFGKPVADFQNTRFKIAEMMTEARALRAFIDECTLKLATNDLDTVTASMAKLKATELQGEIIDGCLQFFGGYGYMREFPIARAFVDARVQRIYGGTSEVMKEIIARDVLGR
ncbi:MAG: acyl-CoA dehydrogenase family protein [Alphaproteobacteria bacterium]|jgi:alkylation response protein AidB-like acyl-CoA dehydrogenase|nr:acyl-CoA dehydrogenase family protein [Alphaproteobacteria bacterium]MDP6817602.1 acyl-CoA dehydrogenase family protein [Alphaproteobacteria bacterium]